jgi:folate-binding protein YgfZ
MYRLRAKADIEEARDLTVLAAWGGAPQAPGLSFADPRRPELGLRILAASPVAANATEAEYHAHRIALGVPEAGKDYALGDTFPHEANFDVLNGVSFTKGCFVGQEVVSRMQHRGTARKRIVIVEADAPLPPGAEITAGAAAIGTIGSTAGNLGLALLRLDRAGEARSKGEALVAGGVPVAVRLPDYLRAAAPATAS